MFLLTTQKECKAAVEQLINKQFGKMECAICLNEINNINKGYVYITSGGTADLERAMCLECDKRIGKNDPYKRKIDYKFEYPFINDEHAKSFVKKSCNFILNEGDDDKIENFKNAIKQTENGYQDIEIDVKLVF
ncbi:Ac53 [Cnaphalocrocis medinalis granulovirus]|uniref:Ac53 n=1 Tax=Cnaphalocrocis medinalis granulovirus TaxID=1750712 RepID=A0A0X9GJV7_9BBAC|nr:Ac53 [Cnaphalocrocis medinalis granulovirus]ALN42058.1 ac53 [Cnaphalocrocis medinalis granulovirus]AMF83864.1 Ac53 [Cnaphalocrocis medinalis granulovirus]WPN08746.1 Ac53 [Cnaphalocrocis medinalis granulovirus]